MSSCQYAIMEDDDVHTAADVVCRAEELYVIENGLSTAAFDDLPVIEQHHWYMRATEGLSVHPKNWGGPCMCAVCRNYG